MQDAEQGLVNLSKRYENCIAAFIGIYIDKQGTSQRCDQTITLGAQAKKTAERLATRYDSAVVMGRRACPSRRLTWAYALEDAMRAKRLITRTIVAAVAAGSIATGIAVPVVAAAPAAPIAAMPAMIGYGG